MIDLADYTDNGSYNCGNSYDFFRVLHNNLGKFEVFIDLASAFKEYTHSPHNLLLRVIFPACLIVRLQ